MKPTAQRTVDLENQHGNDNLKKLIADIRNPGLTISMVNCNYLNTYYSAVFISLTIKRQYSKNDGKSAMRKATVPPRNNLSKTASETRPRRVPPACAGARRRVRAASRPHPTRVRPASAGARRRVYLRELLAFVACGRVDDVNI